MNKRINVYLMYTIVFLQGFVFYGPVATLFRQARGLSMYEIFFIESISWILMIIFEVPWGWFADRFGYKKTLVLSNFFFFISKIIFYKAYSFGMFLTERVLLSIVMSGISGCDIALLYSSVNEDEAQKVFGTYNAYSTSGFLIASLMSSMIIKYSLDRTAFFTIIPYGIAAILTFFIKEVDIKYKEKPKFRDSIKTSFSNKRIIIFVLSVALFREVVQAVSVFLNQLQYLRSGINMQYFGLLVAVVQIVRLSSAKAYRISNKFGKNKSIKYLYILIAVCCFMLVFTNNPIFSIVFIMLVSGSMALIEPIALDVQNQTIKSGDRATILSIYAMMGDIVAASTNLFIGKAANISIEAAFRTCVIVCICAYMLFFFYKIKNCEDKKIKEI